MMTHRTKGVVSSCAAMMAAGFTHFQLTSMEPTTSAFVKASVVGAVAVVVSVVMLLVLPPRKSA